MTTAFNKPQKELKSKNTERKIERKKVSSDLDIQTKRKENLSWEGRKEKKRKSFTWNLEHWLQTEKRRETMIGPCRILKTEIDKQTERRIKEGVAKL